MFERETIVSKPVERATEFTTGEEAFERMEADTAMLSHAKMRESIF
jgi:hypothetical protein